MDATNQAERYGVTKENLESAEGFGKLYVYVQVLKQGYCHLVQEDSRAIDLKFEKTMDHMIHILEKMVGRMHHDLQNSLETNIPENSTAMVLEALISAFHDGVVSGIKLIDGKTLGSIIDDYQELCQRIFHK